jgi:hypothetical protein
MSETQVYQKPVQNGLFDQGILEDRAEKKNYGWFGVKNGKGL